MERPCQDGPTIGGAEVIETHISRLFLSPNRVYKMVRPVRTSFVDFTSRASRLRAAAVEFELNKRISPDVYLGVVDIVEDGEVADRMIVMDRLPADRQLDHLIHDPEFLNHLREVARLIATFHAGQPPVKGASAEVASAAALRRNWDDNFDVVEAVAGPVVPVEEFRRARQLVDQYIAGRGTLFRERIDNGRIRDGHGDLRCEHVFCTDDGPRLIDCLAFRDDFRVSDVLNDVAFMAMDIHRLVGPAEAKWFIDHYGEFSNEHHPASLAHHYVAYRAYVRAKIAAIRFGQGDEQAAAEILTHHRLAMQHLELGRPRLILVGGGAGVGKSTVATGVADKLAVTCLRADEIRKNTAGMAADHHAFADPDTGLYAPEVSEATYEEMLREAALLLERGESVILDASWSHQHHRQMARDVAERTSAEVVELMCRAPLAVAKERIARRMASVYNPSDATPAIAEHIAANFDDWPTAYSVDSDRPVAQVVADAYNFVMTDPSRTEPPATSIQVEGAALTYETIGFFVSRIRRLDRS